MESSYHIPLEYKHDGTITQLSYLSISNQLPLLSSLDTVSQTLEARKLANLCNTSEKTVLLYLLNFEQKGRS